MILTPKYHEEHIYNHYFNVLSSRQFIRTRQVRNIQKGDVSPFETKYF